MSGITIAWGQLDKLFTSMNEVGAQSDEIVAYAHDHICSKAGFTGALSPLGDAMPTIGGWFDDMDDVFDQRWASLAGAIRRSAQSLDETDDSVSIDFEHLRDLGPRADGSNAVVTVDMPRLMAPDAVSDALSEPERGDDSLNHNNKFDWVAEAWDGGVSILEQGVEMLREIGFDAPEVPVKSLRDYVVYPLSGDWGAIRANGNACTSCQAGMAIWGTNFSKLSLDVAAVMQGQTSLALTAHMNLYNVAATAIGWGVSNGQAVFDEIAELCERIGREVEDALTWLGDKITKLLTKIGTRLIPFAGWGLLAIEVAIKGKDAFLDIWEDVTGCFDMVSDLVGLVDEVEAWATAQAERLDAFEAILKAAEQLPQVGPEQDVTDLAQDVSDVQQAVDDVLGFDAGGADEQGTVEDTLDSMDERDVPPPSPEFHKEPLPLEDFPDDAPLPGPDQRLTY